MFHLPKILIEVFNVYAGMEFSRARAEKNFKGFKDLWRRAACEVALLLGVIVLFYFLFFVPGISVVQAVSASFLFTALSYSLAIWPINLGEEFFSQKNFFVLVFITLFYPPSFFQSTFLPVPTSPPRFFLAA